MALNIAHTRKTNDEGKACGIDRLTSWDMQYFSPFYFFNGTDAENDQIQRIYIDENWQIPKSKMIIADGYYPPNSNHNDNQPAEHHNTHDQVISFFQQITDQESQLFAVDEVAIVSSSSQFVRIPFYLKFAEEMFADKLRYPLTYYLYALPECEEFAQRLNEEKVKLSLYASKGHLATTPSPNLFIA